MKLSVMAAVKCPECGSHRERNADGTCPDCGAKAIVKVKNEIVSISENVEAYIKKHLNAEVLESMKKSQESLQKFFESKQLTDSIRSVQALKKRTNLLNDKIAKRKTKPFTIDAILSDKKEIDETTNELLKKVLEGQDEMREEDLSLSRNNIEVEQEGDMISLHLTSLTKNKDFVVVLHKNELSRVDKMNLAEVSRPSIKINDSSQLSQLKNISETLKKVEENLKKIPMTQEKIIEREIIREE